MAEQAPGSQGLSEVRSRREKVLARYQGFKEAAKLRREQLEGARKFQKFRRDADELESWIKEKIQIVSDESYKDRTNLQVRGEEVVVYASGIRGWSLCSQSVRYLFCGLVVLPGPKMRGKLCP